jgi:glycosyltransferase involved in cell wall biosynthesis
MRVVLVAEVFLPKIDGVVGRTVKLIEGLASAGDDVLVVAPQAEGSGRCPVPVVSCRSFPFRSYPEYRIGLPDASLVSAVRQFEPDIVHYINPFAFGFRAFDRIQRSLPVTPSVFSFHTLYAEFVKGYRLLGTLSRPLWGLTRTYHNRADANLTVSSIMREELAGRGFRRVELWPPAVDTELFSPSRACPNMRARLTGERPDRRLLLTVSRLAPEKNVEFLAGLIGRLPEASLAIVGDGPHRVELERTFTGTDTRFVGYLKGESLAAAYASADAFVYASETETMGNVVLEAMAAGCPVVAPAAGGIPSLVADGSTGLLYAPRDLDAAVDATGRLLSDSPLWKAIAGRARQDAEGRSWKSAVDSVRGVYRSAIDEAPSQRPAPGRAQQRLARFAVDGLVLASRLAAPRRRRPVRVPQEAIATAT